MKKIGWITGKKKLLRLAGLSLMGVLLLSGCGNTGKSAVAAASSTSASETSNEAGKGSKVAQPAENVDAQVAEASLPQPGEAISASLTWKSRMELAYATQFAVDTYEDADGMQYEAVSVADGSRFLLIPEGGKVPEDLPDSIQVLKRPVKQIYLVATATMDMFRMLGALPDIRFSGTDASGWYIPEAKEAMENGSILYAGKYSEPDYERIVSEGCGLAIENTMILHSPEVKEKLESFGIPVLVDQLRSTSAGADGMDPPVWSADRKRKRGGSGICKAGSGVAACYRRRFGCGERRRERKNRTDGAGGKAVGGIFLYYEPGQRERAPFL